MRIETKLNSKGQITIPKRFREAIGIAPNSVIELERVGDHIIIRRKGSSNHREHSFTAPKA